MVNRVLTPEACSVSLFPQSLFYVATAFGAPIGEEFEAGQSTLRTRSIHKIEIVKRNIL